MGKSAYNYFWLQTVRVQRKIVLLRVRVLEYKISFPVVTTSTNTGGLRTVKIGEFNSETVDTFFYLESKITPHNSYDGKICVWLLPETISAYNICSVWNVLPKSQNFYYTRHWSSSNSRRLEYSARRILATFKRRILCRISGPLQADEILRLPPIILVRDKMLVNMLW